MTDSQVPRPARLSPASPEDVLSPAGAPAAGHDIVDRRRADADLEPGVAHVARGRADADHEADDPCRCGARRRRDRNRRSDRWRWDARRKGPW